MDTKLADWLKTHPHKGFSGKPRTNDGHTTHFFTEDRCYAHQVNPKFTVYLSVLDGSVVGYQRAAEY